MDVNKYIIFWIMFEFCYGIGRTYGSIGNEGNEFADDAGSLVCSRG
jgi:hypothetical protein